MKSLLIPLAVLLVLGAIALVALKKRASREAGPGEPWPFYVKRPLTQPEQILYHRLIRALPEHIVLAQVQVSRVLGVKKGSKFHEWNNRINRMSYDFVVCSKDATVIAAVELDDKSHEAPDRALADEKKSRASVDAGLRLVRWNVSALPSEDLIRAELLAPVLLVDP